MKSKIIVLACSLLAAISFSSCEDFGFLETILGSSNLTVSESSAPTFYTDSTEVHFSSCINDCVDTDSLFSYMMIAAAIDLQSSEVVEAPYLAVAFRDTVPQTYTIECPLTIDSFATFNAGKLLNTIEGHNLFVMAASDTCWYVGYEGTAEFDAFPASGMTMDATFTNVKAYYVTQSTVEYLEDLVERMNNFEQDAIDEFSSLTLDNLFAHVTFNGSAHSRRAPLAGIVSSIE